MTYYKQASPSPGFILASSTAAPDNAVTFWPQALSAGKAAAPKASNNLWLQLQGTLCFPSAPPVYYMPQRENIETQFSGGYYKKVDFCKQL